MNNCRLYTLRHSFLGKSYIFHLFGGKSTTFLFKICRRLQILLHFFTLLRNSAIIHSPIWAQRKRRPRYCLLAKRGLRITLKPNKQQETYADMTNYSAEIQQSECVVTPIGIYCYFDSGFNRRKLRSFVLPNTKRQ